MQDTLEVKGQPQGKAPGILNVVVQQGYSKWLHLTLLLEGNLGQVREELVACPWKHSSSLFLASIRRVSFVR